MTRASASIIGGAAILHIHVSVDIDKVCQHTHAKVAAGRVIDSRAKSKAL